MDKSLNTDCEKCKTRCKSVFCDMGEKGLSELSHGKVTNTYKKDSTIFHHTNPVFGLYCMSSGIVKISKFGNNGKESIVRIAGPGDVIGHRSLFSTDHFNATATVIEEAKICFFNKNLIFKLLNEDKSLGINLIRRLSKEMGEAEAKTAAMTQKDVSQRLAGFFMNLLKSYGVEEGKKTLINIRLTREEIASMIGTANETVIRFISKFKDDGILEQDRKNLYVINKERLKEVAEFGLLKK
jgi:CRP-like cAMP-binding protein